MIVGATLVLVTWGAAAVLIVLLGLWPATLGARNRGDALRRAMWWGLAIGVAVVLALSLVMPMGSSSALIIAILLSLLGGAAGVVRFRRLTPGASLTGTSWMRWLVGSALGVALIYLAVAALGPVTNYDSGLYHLGALRYQQEFGLVPGIANLFFPLGYGNSVIPLSAFLGSTPWQADGFRLLNGLLMVLLALELAGRIRLRRWTPGTWLLITSLGFIWIPLVALSDYWVTSPTSDSSVLILTTVAVAYLADAAVDRPARYGPNVAVAVVISWVLVSMRPTMAVFSLAVIAATAVLVLRSRRWECGGTNRTDRTLVAATLSVGVAIAGLQVARDRVLSGWLQYPLSLFSFDVPWQAADPVWFRTATLGAARDPQDLWGAAQNWNWIPGWLGRAPTQWEFWLALLMAVTSAVVVLAARQRRVLWRPRALLVAATPSLLATVVWFVASPPAFRFIWGPLFTLVALPAAFALAGLTRGERKSDPRQRLQMLISTGAGIAVIGVVAFSAVARLDVGSMTQGRQFALGPLQVPYAVTPLPEPPVSVGTLESGLEVVFPTESDQCWSVYPLCTAQIEQTVRLLGPNLNEGFAR